MEMTLTSALSAGGLLGHLSYILLIVSMMSQSMVTLRLIVIASAVPAIAYDWIWLSNPVGVFWEGLLVAVNVVQLVRFWLADRLARFTDDERAFVEQRLRLASRGEARRLLDTGAWVDLPAGTDLTQEGRRPDALHYIASGAVDVKRLGVRLAGCGAGDFVGEMAMLEEDGVASATAITATPVRAWRLPYRTLDRMARKQPVANAALQAAIARDMRLKIVAQNSERLGF